ncbi:MAG: NUDIX domain-containing protein [Flavobacteriales bacterium]|nr:NUDIX domain-containing protein [Flavobacteriales bacterium]
MKKVFNIRVYGILIHENKVLVTDEHRFGKSFTKFVGGGLEFGEGTIDCLKRECREEMDLEIDGISHFYTTDFFQASAFHTSNQIISIYYLVQDFDSRNIRISEREFDFEVSEGAQSFRWIEMAEISPEHFTFPIDKKVAELLSVHASNLR